jgi:hypothetical protein
MHTKPHRAGNLIACLALLVAGLGAARQLATWPTRLRYPGELTGVEGMRLVEMEHLRQGRPVYAPASAETFDAMIYGPLYYLLGAHLIDPQAPAYFPLRVLSSMATLGLAAGCALLAFWISRSYLAAALGAALFLAYGHVTQFGTSARSDSLALLLFLAGFLVAYRFQNSGKLHLAVPLMLMGFYHKQQFVAGALAVVLFLLLEKRYRRAAEFAGLMAAGGAGLGSLFQFMVFRGQNFLLHFVVYNRVPWSWPLYRNELLLLGVFFAIPILFAAKFLRSHPDKLLNCYLGSACLLCVLTIGKMGSYTNFFLECFLISAILVACSVAERVGNPARAPVAFALLVIVVFLGQMIAGRDPQREDFSRDRAIQDLLRRNFPPGTPALGFQTGDLVRAGLENPYSDIYQYSQLVREGTLSEQDLLKKIGRRRFGIIVVDLDLQNGDAKPPYDYCFSWPMRRAIREYYQPLTSLELPGPEKDRDDYRFWAWVPR